MQSPIIVIIPERRTHDKDGANLWQLARESMHSVAIDLYEQDVFIGQITMTRYEDARHFRDEHPDETDQLAQQGFHIDADWVFVYCSAPVDYSRGPEQYKKDGKK